MNDGKNLAFISTLGFPIASDPLSDKIDRDAGRLWVAGPRSRFLANRERLRHWLVVILFSAAAASVAWLILQSALDKGVSWFNRAILSIIALSAAAILWRINPDLRALVTGRVSPFRTRKNSETALNLLLTFLSLTASTIGLMAPRPATERSPGSMEAAIDNTSQKVNQIATAVGAGHVVLGQRIVGLWGEGDACDVTYRIAVQEGALVMDSVRDVPGLKPYHWEGDIRGVSGRTLSTVTRSYGADKGVAVRFSYFKSGSFETLTRDDESGVTKLDLRRCE